MDWVLDGESGHWTPLYLDVGESKENCSADKWNTEKRYQDIQDSKNAIETAKDTKDLKNQARRWGGGGYSDDDIHKTGYETKNKILLFSGLAHDFLIY